jgi:AcrR family transcriptional regulator
MSGSGTPDPPWRAKSANARRSPLSRDAIVDAAFEVLDREGLDALSMRRLAQQLGAGAASLYWHVRNKDELIDLMLDRAVGELPLPGPPDPERWQEQVKEFARGSRRVFAAHRDLARASLGRVPFGPNLLEVIERSLAIMKAGGVPDRIAAYAGDLIALYVAASSFEDDLGADGGPMDDFAAMAEGYLASLPPDRFPLILAMRGELLAGDSESRFELGLDVIVAGLASFATRDPGVPVSRSQARSSAGA